MSIDNNGATRFFKDHVRGSVWNGFAEPSRAVALLHARRLLARTLGRAISDAEAVYAEGDTVREEYAVYEQALWMLENGVIANGEQSAPSWIATDPEKSDNARDSQKALLSPEALRWLGVRGHGLVLVQG